MTAKWVRYFILSAGGILLAAGLIRLLIVLNDAPVLVLPEPVLGLPLGYIVLTVGILELIVATFCLFGKQLGLQIGWLIWLVTNFIVYWFGLIWQHDQTQGAGWGTLTDPLRLSHGMTG